ncbi:High-affinity zinc uptake system membrane protein ZnuB [Corynebacterium ciconiae DSM 44920]|uniref:metal ABC transporter permease n=1 Tax=Corynebacterium ciconiae TaxID=227319 RepID=UPI0003658F7F|nr:metal ABC transporter permease [Corynebacterium ciconiae]WKD62012.1 High-affinity zinc uptake system membrane protein ZnuB [Corynebacterium ciconiae DSM 44920]
MLSILTLPIIELIVVGALAGLVGCVALLNRQIFFAEAITHATFPGAVLGVIIGAAFGLNQAQLSLALFAGALLMCWPIGALFSLSRVGTSQSAAGLVLTTGFALGYFLNKLCAPLPIKVESFLVGSVLTVTAVDVLLAVVLLAIVLVVLAGGWRRLVFYAFDPAGFAVAHKRHLAQGLISGLIVLSLVALIPAVGTILSIALLAAPAATAAVFATRPSTLFLTAPLLGVAIGLGGLAVAVACHLSAGGCIGLVAAMVFAAAKLASLAGLGRG